MSIRGVIERLLNYSPLVAATIYGAVVLALLTTTWLALAGIYSGESALAETSSLLERLQGRKAAPLADGGTMTGSPFLEGPSVTVAGAALLVESLWRLERVPLGFQPEQVLATKVNLPPSQFPDKTRQMRFWEELLERAGRGQHHCPHRAGDHRERRRPEPRMHVRQLAEEQVVFRHRIVDARSSQGQSVSRAECRDHDSGGHDRRPNPRKDRLQRGGSHAILRRLLDCLQGERYQICNVRQNV